MWVSSERSIYTKICLKSGVSLAVGPIETGDTNTLMERQDLKMSRRS